MFNRIASGIVLVFGVLLSQNIGAQSLNDKLDVFRHSKTSLLTWNEIIGSRWEQLDDNHDGMLSSGELGGLSWVFRILVIQYFDDIDINKDGKVTRDELMKYSKEQELKQKQKINKKWNQLDVDRDFRITQDEVRGDKNLKSHFDEVNHGQAITVESLIVFYNQTLLKQLRL